MLRNRIYFGLKPFVPLKLRIAIRRGFALRLRERVRDIWPIMPGSERVPDGWPGWPDGKKFALVLTHDVERQVGLDKCRALLRLEQELGFWLLIQFCSGGSDKVSAQLREELVRNGFEVGVHDLKHDGRLYRSRREFRQRAARINHYLAEWGAVGFRSAFMLRKLDWLHELGIGYDASTFDTDPFEPQPEGCQTIFPFWVPASVAKKSEVSPPEADQKSDRTTTSETLTSHPASSRILSEFTINHPRSGYVEFPYTCRRILRFSCCYVRRR